MLVKITFRSIKKKAIRKFAKLSFIRVRGKIRKDEDGYYCQMIMDTNIKKI